MGKKVKIVILALGLGLMIPTFAHAAFISYNQPVYASGANYYGTVNNKQTNNSYVTNNITSDHDSFTALNCWVGNENGTGIGQIIRMSEGQTRQLPHWKENRKVKLVFENATWVPWNGEVSGRVDYH